MQADLLSWTPPDTDRHGSTYDRAFDFTRLNRQQRLVWEVMKDGEWHTIAEISEKTGALQTSVSARYRELGNMFRLPTEKRRGENGLWFYRVRTE